jgi:hypothetical protein
MQLVHHQLPAAAVLAAVQPHHRVNARTQRLPVAHHVRNQHLQRAHAHRRLLTHAPHRAVRRAAPSPVAIHRDGAHGRHGALAPRVRIRHYLRPPAALHRHRHTHQRRTARPGVCVCAVGRA